MRIKKPLFLLGSILITSLAAFIGSFFTFNKIDSWYAALNKPSFNPPNWLFSPVWTILYILMAVSLYLVSLHGFEKKQVREAMKVFAIQLILNAAWSIIFFGAQSILGALILIFALWLVIAYTIYKFSKVDKVAGYLLYPYLAWVSFATVLNYSIWILNR